MCVLSVPRLWTAETIGSCGQQNLALSGCSTFIAMVKVSEFGNYDDHATLHTPMFYRALLFERKRGTRPLLTATGGESAKNESRAEPRLSIMLAVIRSHPAEFSLE